MRKEELIRIFSRKIRGILERTSADFLHVEEIRLRAGKPLTLCLNGREEYLDEQGRLVPDWQQAYQVLPEDLAETLEYVSHYSLYAFEEELRQGFITIPGGHRVGLAGKAVVSQGEIRSLKYISFINVRMAHQVIGCAGPILPYLWKHDRIKHTLIISPPRLGKTTLLRDMIRQISNGDRLHRHQTVGVVDERSELGACSYGVPQNDLGLHTDVLDSCPKASGIRMLLRTMSPHVIAIDEVGTNEDLDALAYSMRCGCSILATVHGSSLQDIAGKPVLSRLVHEQLFDLYVVLRNDSRRGIIWQVLDAAGNQKGEGIR